MSTDADFQKAAEEAKALPSGVTNDEKLTLYGLYKQANEGDCTTKRPGMMDPKGKAKWDAWDKLKGKDKDTAKQEYVMKVEELKEKYAS